MSDYLSIVILWSKGAYQRKRILLEIARAQKEGNPIFVSKIAERLISLSENQDKHDKPISLSAVRKHVKVLTQFGFIKSINLGGKPEYLQLTTEGEKAVQLLSKNDE